MYHFLWQPSLKESSLRRCKEDIQTIKHILCDCPMKEKEVKRQLDEFSWKNLGHGCTDIAVDLLNCPRNSKLATICMKIIRNPKLKLWHQKKRNKIRSSWRSERQWNLQKNKHSKVSASEKIMSGQKKTRVPLWTLKCPQ